MKRITRVAVAALATVSVAVIAAPTQGIDSAYRVTGDQQAAPIQAFSVDSSLYLQLRNTKAVPVPLASNGQPLQYRIYGPYMILPLMRQITLHYGQWTAYVTAAGYSAQASAPAVMRAPVNAADPQPEPVPPVVPAIGTALPAPTPIAPAAPTNVVTGSIAAGTATATKPTASFSSANGQTVPQGSVPGLLRTEPQLRKGVLTITADGTVSGARAADAAMQQCVALHGACRVKYAGAPAGQIILETAP